ncbi:membrane-spanning 4-domains subfamily A member 4A-like [Conger conger]|uniref:membrane-spanning 4-domains subfamily A member 4A-like n=1 Tax=Conger conger TaxID=82655 RepID=UPI002A5AFB9E|nr:membrane-spanning 4-domains subfamily A member 4A-like [Conger conger]XP_061110047.1 membrane-spanning 4-domains subfamily A member 4A-like [Conger conger]
MSVSVTTVNGLVVVTQVFQQGEEMKIPLNTIPTPAAPAAAKPVESVEPSSPVSPMTKRFIQGQPKPLGTVQILIGLVTIALGIMLLWQRPLFWGAPLWSGSLYVLSGTIAVIAHKGTRPSLINSTMALSTLSCVAAVAAIVIYTVSLITVRPPPDGSGCGQAHRNYDYNYDSDNYYWMCQEMYWKYWTVLDGVRGLLLVLSALELCVAFTSVVFAGKASCSSSVAGPSVLVIERPSLTAGGNCGSDEALLGGDDTMGNPPPYDA